MCQSGTVLGIGANTVSKKQVSLYWRAYGCDRRTEGKGSSFKVFDLKSQPLGDRKDSEQLVLE